MAIEFGFEDLVKAQARYDGGDEGDVVDELKLLEHSAVRFDILLGVLEYVYMCCRSPGVNKTRHAGDNRRPPVIKLPK